MSKRKSIPVLKAMCATCPFRDGSPYAYLVTELTKSALSAASRVCHSTGSSAINRRTGKRPRLCRGARDIQLRYFRAVGFIDAATDEAWEKKRKELGL
jgi:hypothetical protein